MSEEIQNKIIAQNHAADVQNGLSEQQASESDAFERRVLGIESVEDDKEDHEGPIFRNGKCTRCRRSSDYCEC